MARFILSNSNDIVDQVTKRFELQGFTRSVSLSSDDGLHIAAFHKKNFRNKNYFQDGKDWIVGVGIYLSFDVPQQDVLKWVLNKFSGGQDIATIQAAIVGHFAFIIHKNGKTVTFTDGIGTLNFYHSSLDIPEGVFVASNNITVVSDFTPGSEMDEEGVLMEYAYGMAGGRTPVKRVQRLVGSGQYLMPGQQNKVGHIGSKRFQIKRRDLSKESRDEIVSDYIGKVRSVFGLLRGFDFVGSFNTGGLDSRTVLAAAVDSNYSPPLYYGIGNSPILNTREEDKLIVTEISRRLNLPLTLMNWHTSADDCTEEAIEKSVWNYGLGGHEYAGGPGLHGALASLNPEGKNGVFLIGMGPAFANGEHYYIRYNSLRDLALDTTGVLSGRIWFRKPAHIVREAEIEIRKYCTENSLVDSSGNFTTDGDIIRTLLQFKPESENVNIFNDYDYYFVPFGTMQLFLPILEVPLELRDHRWFQIELIKRLCPELLKIDLFTGIKPLKIDTDNNLIVYNQPPKRKVSDRKFYWLDGLRHLYYTMRTGDPLKSQTEVVKSQYNTLAPQFEKSRLSRYWRKPYFLGVKSLRHILVFSKVNEKERRTWVGK